MRSRACRASDETTATPKGSLSLTRRALLRRGVALGVSAPLFAGLLAACGGSSSPATTSAGSETSTTTSGGTSATPTPASTTASPSVSATPSAVGSPSGQTGSSAFTIEPAKHKGGKLIYGGVSDAKTANPILYNDGPSGTIIAMMFEGLVRADPATTNPLGLLAKSWDISADGTRYAFTLQDGVKWQDGQPFTANDVKFTYELMLNDKAKSPRYSTLSDRIASIDVVDDTHLTFTLRAPNAAFLASNMGYGIIPQHILKDVDPAALAADTFSTGKKGRTIGTGPFTFEEWVKDDHITLVKNPSYWQGEPNLDQWIVKIVPNQTVLSQQLKTGEVDYGGIDPASFGEMQKQDNLKTYAYNTFSFTHYCINLDPAKTTVFQDKEVRQALFYALDRQGIADAVYFGLAVPAVGTMPLISWAYNPNGITVKYPHDPEKAKSLLDSAGWKPGSDGIRVKNGKRLAFKILTASSSQTAVEQATISQQAWKQIGAECSPETEEWNAYLTRISSSRDYDIYLEGFGWSVDPDQSSMWACDAYKTGFNDAKYCNPQVDKLLNDALATTDHAKRKQIYTQMQNILLEDVPQIISHFTKTTYGVNQRVHNMFPNAVSISFNAYQWWVDA